MKIAFDTSALDPEFKEHATRGIGRYVRELKSFFDRNQIADIEYFDHRKLIKDSKVAKLISYLPAGRVTLQQQLLYPFKLQHEFRDFDYLHFCAQMDAPSWCNKPYIITVHDIIPLVLSDLYKAEQPGWRFKLARKLELAAIKNASLILTNSYCTANDLKRVLGISSEKIHVTQLGIDQKFLNVVRIKDSKLLNKYQINSSTKLMLYVGGLDPRKNYPVMLKTLQGFKDQDVKLIFVGNIKSNKNYASFKQQMIELGVADSVIETGYLSEEDLLSWYSTADVFLFPSLYEGFGLPPLEAMAAGLPVISSNTSAMPEVLDKYAIMIDPTDVSAIIQAVKSVFADSELVNKMSLEGRRHAAQFTWDRTGEETLAAYRSLIK